MKKIISGGTGEFTDKKSRFIANIYHIEDEDMAVKIIEQLRKKYWDARHNCYAYVLGGKSEIQRFSDDGEPSGTAGKPILEVITGNECGNCLCVVTRYFPHSFPVITSSIGLPAVPDGSPSSENLCISLLPPKTYA